MALIGKVEVNGTDVDGLVVVERVFGGKQQGGYTALVHVYFGPRFRRAGLKIADFNVQVPYFEGEDPVRMAYHAIKNKFPGLEADQGVVAPSADLLHYLRTHELPATTIAPPVVVTPPEAAPVVTEAIEEQAMQAIEEIEAAPVEQRPGLIRRLLFWRK